MFFFFKCCSVNFQHFIFIRLKLIIEVLVHVYDLANLKFKKHISITIIFINTYITKLTVYGSIPLI